jgi:hypothetical protein
MALRAASSIQAYTGPDGCKHSRSVVKTGTGKNTKEEPGDFVIACVKCEPTLAGSELWGPADQPPPLTIDEERVLKANQTDANRSMLEGIAAIPGMIDVLRQLVESAKPGK